MWVATVTIDGATIPLDDVLAALVIRHGVAGVDDAPTASSVHLVLKGMGRSYASTFRVGVPIVITADDGLPRFTGTITDASLDDDLLTVVGIGALAATSRWVIGTGDWPAEPWSDRVQRVFSEAGIPELLLLSADSNFDPVIAARTADPSTTLTLLDYLRPLADEVGAIVADTPDGRILVQQLTARLMVGGLTWDTTPATLAWNGCDPACTWEQATTLDALDPGASGAAGSLVVDPDDCLYVPTWVQELALENSIEVTYSGGTVTHDEPASIDTYGPYPGSLTTTLVQTADAETRAAQRVDRRSFPRWIIPAVQLLSGHDGIELGMSVQLSGFPAGSPYADWTGVLEGWTDQLDGADAGNPAGSWMMQLALSDPYYSGVVLKWLDLPASLAWNGVEPACRWTDATSLDALTPTRSEALSHA